MILSKLQNETNLTNSEKEIAKYLLKEKVDLAHLSAQELGKLTFTSKATVLRFIKKLGFDSFNDFRFALDKELQCQKINEFLTSVKLTENTQPSDVLNILPRMYQKFITHENSLIDADEFSRIIKKLDSLDRIDFYGAGITESIAEGAAFKFSTLGKESSIRTSINEHYLASLTKKNTYGAILLSFTGGNEMTLRVAKFLKELNIYTIGIGGRKSTELKKLVNDYLEIPSADVILGLESIEPYLAMTYLVDAMYISLTAKRFDKNIEVALKVKKLAD